MSLRDQQRKIINRIMLFLTGACCLATVGLLLLILFFLFWHGAGSLSWAFVTELPRPVGEAGGGVANAIVGTAAVVAVASAAAFPIGFFTAVYLSEFGRGRFAAFVRFVIDLLNGVPSIVVGVFAYAMVVLPAKHFSAWAGAFALAVLMIPTIVRTTEEYLRGVPLVLREAAYALGATKWRTIVTVVIPAAKQGIFGGLMLGVGRIAGETAPLLFTSFGNNFWSRSLNEPTATLPVTIFNYAISPYAEWRRQAWACSFLLLTLVLSLNLAVRYFGRNRP